MASFSVCRPCRARFLFTHVHPPSYSARNFPCTGKPITCLYPPVLSSGVHPDARSDSLHVVVCDFASTITPFSAIFLSPHVASVNPPSHKDGFGSSCKPYSVLAPDDTSWEPSKQIICVEGAGASGRHSSPILLRGRKPEDEEEDRLGTWQKDSVAYRAAMMLMQRLGNGPPSCPTFANAA